MCNICNSQRAPRPSSLYLGALLDQPLPQPGRLARQVALARTAVGEGPGEGDDVASEGGRGFYRRRGTKL